MRADPEVQAMAAVVEALEPLDHEARRRVVAWAQLAASYDGALRDSIRGCPSCGGTGKTDDKECTACSRMRSALEAARGVSGE